ncbi:flavin-containing monooxygenase [Roseomonas chloroacetimidivorans]|uniref:flavin-containing monooxygenase n=1 Tax=Roseomonas chloroacetimidivorans TaxID=1766656 RepID=UPI003C78DB61
MNATPVEHVRTLILGAGFGGLGIGAQFARRGDRDFLILERSAGIGGVWRENSYPGAACDTEAHLYCYSFFPHLRVSRMYAGRAELLDYLQSMTEAFSLQPHIRFDSEVLAARWDGAAKLWRLEVGGGKRYTAQFFVTAWGQLNKPSVPAFEGLDRFHGKMFHSAEWDHSVELKGKRVASVGNAASAVQYVPEIAPLVAHLTVFQRSPNWIMPRNQVLFTPELLEAFEVDPRLFDESRKRLHDFREAGFQRTRVGTADQAEGMRIAKEHLEKHVPDPDLRAKLTPDYEFACKRILRSDDYFPALCRDNVTLETRRIAGLYEDGIVTEDGAKHPFDVVIFGTGFASQAFHGDLVVEGLGGQTLSHAWRDGAEAYLGITVPNFPNLFMIYGPNTNLNHNSIITMLEIQQNYIITAIEEVSALRGAISARVPVFEAFNGKLQADMSNSAFSSGCSSWYKNSEGKVINNWSGTVDQYRAVTQWRPADFDWF